MGSKIVSANHIRNPNPKHIKTAWHNDTSQMRHPFNIRFDKTNNQVILTCSCSSSLLFFYAYHYESNTLNYKNEYGLEERYDRQFNNPCGLCIQPVTNHLIVADSFNHRIQVFTSPTINSSIHPLFMIGCGYENRNGSNKIGYFHVPTSVCCNLKGDIIVIDNTRIQLFDAKGKHIRTCKYFNGKIESCLNPKHNTIMITESVNNTISIWDKDMRQHVRNIKTQGVPRHICVDLNGYIYVSEMHQVIIYDPITFNIVQNIGDRVFYPNNKPGFFNHPRGMCVDDDNNLYVCDYGNNRLQIF
jgi:DNA-binding beta-propeller fold protein YncE